MDIKKIQNLDGVSSGTLNRASKTNDVSGPSFSETLAGKLNSPQNVGALNAELGKVKEGLKFSNHAVDRMQSRGITYDTDDIKRLNEAVSKAAEKGSRDTLILMNDSALIVSVKNNTVVTVMDKNALKENVFTNIDSTIVM